MQELFKRYLDRDISRRTLIQGLSAVGLSSVAASTIAESLAPVSASAAEAAGAVRNVRDTGGTLFIQQLKAAGVKYYFFNPSTGDAPIFNAIANEPSIQLIKGIQEGVVVGMADGYARLSGKTGVCSIANVGLPNGMTQLVNTYKDRIPLLMVIAAFGTQQLGRDGPQDYEHQENMLQPLTKWYWMTDNTNSIPETVRRALKFASTPPGGPVFVAFPTICWAEWAAPRSDESLFNVPMKIRPDHSDIETASRAADRSQESAAVGRRRDHDVEGRGRGARTRRIARPAGRRRRRVRLWSKPFPTMNPLYLGPILRNMRFPGAVDVRVNIGNQLRRGARARRHARFDPERPDESRARIGRRHRLGFRQHLAAGDLVAAVKSMATADR